MESPPAPAADAPSFGNVGFVESLYFDYLADPASVDPAWRAYFERWPKPAEGVAPAPLTAGEVTAADALTPVAGSDGAEPRRSRANGGPAHPARTVVQVRSEAEAFQFRVDRLVHAYRVRGHLFADLDPLGLERRPDKRLRLDTYGLSEADLDRTVASDAGTLGGDVAPRTLRELVAQLEETYCRTIGVEIGHLNDDEQRRWLQTRMERTRNHITLTPEVQRLLLRKLTEAELFESFVGTRFLGAKRFSLEGGEGLVPMLELLVDRASGHGVRDIAIGMAHRGRLNVLANVLGKPARDIFAEFRDRAVVGGGAGDVKYHLGFQGAHATLEGAPVRLSLAFNPSHLEWVNTVVQGQVRARQDRARDRMRSSSLPVLIHGDAAFAGQGIVAECLNMGLLDGYGVGGTVHIVVNNQVGFTTSPRDARSTFYATDVARMLQVPVFHVNGEDLEAVAQVVLLAVDLRQRFRCDTVIDFWCYRKYGHNEGDEPSFTQPVMYRAITQRPSVRQRFAGSLVGAGAIKQAEVDAMAAEVRAALERDHEASAALAIRPGSPVVEGVRTKYRGGGIAAELTSVDTAVPRARLAEVGRALASVPKGFNVHPKVAKLLEGRMEMAEGKRPLDWGMGEALAFGTLAWEGTLVRLAGQDVRRGTFSHRHAVLFDHQSGTPYMPLAHLHEGQGEVEIRDSPLTEAAVLGFEYGYSLDLPDGLVIWEAQFGDFVNCAQVILDQFLSSSEVKWNRLSGLVLLLPHGMEGQGPEHSSARLERFLGLAVDDNWQVVNLTTPAQLYHALRRQVLAPWRKPLVVMSPKSLLRHAEAVSPLDELADGCFRTVIDDAEADAAEVTRVVLCAGKVYYDLVAGRRAGGMRDVALVRLEQLYPLQTEELLTTLARYPEAREVLWVQEEPRNMGAWEFVNLHLSPLLRGNFSFDCLTRPASASPASGSATRHKLEQEALVQQALTTAPPAVRVQGA